MARFYQTAERKYLEDGIYKPPVELMAQVIAAKDAQLDKAVDNINIINNVAGTNIKYWADIDKEQAQELRNEYNTETNELTRYIQEHPLATDIQSRLSNLSNKINADIQQGGRISDLAQNLAAWEKAQEDFGKIEDQRYAQNQLNYALNMYKKEKGNNPTVEGNYFDYNKYLSPTENVDMFGETSKIVKDIVPEERETYYYSKKTGEKVMTETGKRTMERIRDTVYDSLRNPSPAMQAKMINDDIINWNGEGNTWYIYDNNGNPIDINTDSEVVKGLVKENQDVYFKDNKKVKSEIIDEDLFERHYGITKGRKPTDENHYYVAANFISDSDLYRNAASNAYKAYIADKGTPLVIRGDNGHYTGCVMGADGRIWKIAKDERGNTIHDSDGKIVKKPLSDKEWENFGDRFYEARTKENNNNYKSESNKYLGEYYNDEIMNISADKTTFEKVKAAIDGQNEISISDNNFGSYSTQGRKKFTMNSIRTLGDLMRVGANFPVFDENGEKVDMRKEDANGIGINSYETVFVYTPTQREVGQTGNYQATIKLNAKDNKQYYIVVDAPIHVGTGGENIQKGGLGSN